METPSSTKRVTRSQTLSAMKSSATNHLLSSKKPEESKSRQRNGATPKQERSALFDITNDSPIVGLAMQQTPSSGVVGKSRVKSTPGSGEALLRGQVKNLLQKVEEEEGQHLITKISVESRPFIHLVTSPMGLLAPTPANTPQVLDGAQVVIASPVVSEAAAAASSQVKESEVGLEKSPSITRSLLLDFSDKSELWESSDCSSVVTQNPEDDNSSVWSMQVNASTKDEEDDEEDQEVVYSYKEGGDDDEEYYYEDEEEEEGDGGIAEGLCEGMRKMRFAGKHTRFVYDSDLEEMVEAEEQTPGVSRLKVFPTPTGKHHVRFEDDDE